MPRVTMCLDSVFLNSVDAPKSENMKVYARVRPMLQREEDEGYRECIAAIDEETVRAVVPESSAKFKNSTHNSQDIYDFKYSQAFGPEIGQFVFFEQTLKDTMQGFIEGQNCLIFSYGITNSGKTFTLQGDETNPGIIPLSMHLFFGSIEHQLMKEVCVKPDKFSDIFVLKDNERTEEIRLKEELMHISEQESFNKTSSTDCSTLGKSFSQVLIDCFRDNFKYQTETTLPPEEMMAAQSALYMREISKKSADQQPGECNIWISFIEIYNEYIYDLLQPNINQRTKLSLAEDQNGDVYVKGAREICVSNSTEAIKLLQVGRRNLRIASTKLNYQSSRSHCIFTVKVARVCDENNGGYSGKVNRISFCDLAGSERAAKSKTSGMRLKEAGYINTSLMVLGRCLELLRLNQNLKDKKMIPFRESKLTRLFSNHFLGKGKAVMIANASPCEYTFDETLNVLRFSALAKDLAINDSYISMASSSLQNITSQYNKSKMRVSDVPHDQSIDIDSSIMEDLQEKEEMIEKLLDLAESLKQNLEKEKKEKAEIEAKVRQEVCDEFAEYSDELLDKQKRNFEEHIAALKDLYKRRMDAMEDMYKERLNALKTEYEDEDDEESFETSLNKTNATFDKMEESLISFSPAAAPPPKTVSEVEESALVINTSMDCFDTIPDDNEKNVMELTTLKDDLEFVTMELQITKEKLEQTTQSLKESENEEAIAKEICDSLNTRLIEAKQVLEQYKKELAEVKTICETHENNIEQLLKEKKQSEDELLSLSEQHAKIVEEVKELRKDKLVAEERYTMQILESEKKALDLEEKCKELVSELEKVSQVLEEKSKMDNIQVEYENFKNCSNAETNDLKIHLNDISEKLELSIAEVDQLKKEKLAVEESFAKEKADLVAEKERLEEKCKELSSKLNECTEALNIEKSNFSNLKVEFENLKTDNDTVLEDFKILKENCNNITEELELAVAEVELLKKEKLIAEANYTKETTKFLDEKASLEEKCKELNSELENAILTATEEKSNLAGAKESSEDKIASISEQLDLANSEIEKLKKEKLKSEENFEKEKQDMLNENSAAVEESKTLISNLENANKVIQEQELKINKMEEKIKELESSYETCRVINSELTKDREDFEEKIVHLSDKLEELEDSKEKSKELSDELEKITEVLENEKSNVIELISKCSAYEVENAKILEDLKNLEENSAILPKKAENSDVTEELVDLKINLEKANEIIDEQKLKINELHLKITELESTCNTHKRNNSELEKDVKGLQEKYVMQSNDFEDCIRQYENSKELNVEMHEIAQELVEAKSKINELESKCINYEESNTKLLEDIKEWERKYVEASEDKENSLSIKTEELTSKLEKITEELSAKKLRIEEIEEEYSCLKSKNSELVRNLDIEKEKYKQLFEEKVLAISEVEKLQNEVDNFVGANSKTLSDLQTREADLQEKCNELNLKLEESSKTVEDQIIKISQMEEENKEYRNKNLDLSENVKSLEEKFDSYLNTYGSLVEILEKCEFSATANIKALRSSSVENVKQLTDLKRQVREKETSIDELERALCNSQEQIKQAEAETKKQIHALKEQHGVEIEEMSHLKKFVEEENEKLKSSAEKLQKEKEEMQNIRRQEEIKQMEEEMIIEEQKKDMKKIKKQKEETRKKRSLSDISKDDSDLMNKENSEESGSKETRPEGEEKVVTKRRRVLRQRQEPAINFDPSDSESDLKPAKTNKKKGMSKVQSTSNAQKKTAVPKVPATRTSRRKLQEPIENPSPVKKAMAFMGSKLRSVAQSMSNMPSPRITRGRKKLFNADAPAMEKWKL
ncbi:kinesin-like protein KIF20A [Caerostris darwini]|uniref:Kinesin-like protein KIF20A n=1 Tax=Caerostris darwini TaxID=1538125 RepID=A0AAV4TC81_9ARAC|nr:kinesin-like protein KIF20A [Caerostris darwini]